MNFVILITGRVMKRKRRKNMKKVIALLLAAVMVFALCACGQQGAEGKDPAAKLPEFKLGIPMENTANPAQYSYLENMVYLCGNFPNGGTAVAEADDLTDPDHMISSVEKLISAGCNMITICPCNDTMLIKVAKLCEENKVYWAVAWRDILDPEVRDVVYASPYFCGTAVQSDLNAGYAAVKAMGEAGMKKIGLISLDKSSSCAALREKGMQKALDEYGMQVVAEARDLQQAADAAQAVESFIVANPDLDGVYIACSMGMNILDGTLSALEQYDPDNHIKISVIDFLTGLDTCFEKDRIICAQGGIYIPVQIACGMLEMNAILNGGRLGGQAWDVPISFGAVGSAEEFKDYSKFCEGALPTYTFEELQNLFITYNPDVTGEDIIAWGNACTRVSSEMKMHSKGCTMKCTRAEWMLMYTSA